MSRFRVPSNVITWLLILTALAMLTPEQVQRIGDARQLLEDLVLHR